MVTKTDDTDDGLCTVDDCSLREAISNVNSDPDANTIGFDIDATTDSGCVSATGVCTIKPTLALPEIINPVLIDGYSPESMRYQPRAVLTAKHFGKW